MSVNRYIGTGNLTRDPVLRELPAGRSVCELRVAVEGMARGRETGYINVCVYDRPGEAAAEHLSKGWLVAVDGRLEWGEWEREDGEKRHDYRVIGNVTFLAAPRSKGNASQQRQRENGDPHERKSASRARREPAAA
ncbi:MAG TPA: single-stranded DNA-binding protein [Solirubrobacteraceae bacterium]|nr:single-stranded DNA-binding protein [Solirubrobacteraceae bacterium]